MNLYHSALCFTCTPATFASFNWVNMVGAPIATLNVKYGTLLVSQMSNGIEFSRLVGLACMSNEELKSMDLATAGADLFEGYRWSASGTTAAYNMKRYTGASVLAYDEPLYLTPGANGTATPVIHYKLKLRDVLPFTIFQLNGDIPLYKTLQIEITIGGASYWMWHSLSTTDPTATAAAQTTTVAISDIQLMVAYEANEEIQNAVIQLYQTKGIELRYSWIEPYSETLSGTSQNVSIVLPQSTSTDTYWKGAL